MKDIIIKLAKIAEELDSENMFKEATVVDSVMQKLAERFNISPESAWITKVTLDPEQREVMVYVSNEPEFVYVYKDVDPELIMLIKAKYDAGERIGSIIKKQVMLDYPHQKLPITDEYDDNTDEYDDGTESKGYDFSGGQTPPRAELNDAFNGR